MALIVRFRCAGRSSKHKFRTVKFHQSPITRYVQATVTSSLLVMYAPIYRSRETGTAFLHSLILEKLLPARLPKRFNGLQSSPYNVPAWRRTRHANVWSGGGWLMKRANS
jgi:hypothetical protein